MFGRVKIRRCVRRLTPARARAALPNLPVRRSGFPMRVITHGPTRKNVFKEVARLRSRDAKILLDEARLLGAVYLLGYSIECYLKFAACERNEWARLPEVVRVPGHPCDVRLYVHDWAVLVEVAGILASLRSQREIDALYSALSEQWGPNLRYRTAAFAGNQGRDLYNELVQLYHFLKELVP